MRSLLLSALLLTVAATGCGTSFKAKRAEVNHVVKRGCWLVGFECAPSF